MTDLNSKFGPNTKAVHAGRGDFRAIGVHAPPIDLSSTYPFQDLETATESLERLVAGERVAADSIYARLFNPTVDRLESAIAELEGAEGCVAFSSGMAAISACLLAERDRGTHVVAVRPLYGTADHLLSSGLLGTTVTWATQYDIADALRADTALVVIETPANPTLGLVDIEAVVQQAGAVPVMVDSTFATPILQQPLSHGATYSLHSATKFIGGHGDVLAGVVSAATDATEKLRRVRVVTGSLLHPMAAYLLHRSLPTLALRVERAQRSAIELAARLQSHPRIARVLFPGLSECDPAGLVEKQMNGPGSVLSFEVLAAEESDAAGILALVNTFIQGLKLITPAVSLGSTDTLIQHPAGLTHHVVDEVSRQRSGISNSLIRLSVGIEDVEDIWSDLKQSLDLTRQKRRSVRFGAPRTTVSE